MISNHGKAQMKLYVAATLLIASTAVADSENSVMMHGQLADIQETLVSICAVLDGNILQRTTNSLTCQFMAPLGRGTGIPITIRYMLVHSSRGVRVSWNTRAYTYSVPSYTSKIDNTVREGLIRLDQPAVH